MKKIFLAVMVFLSLMVAAEVVTAATPGPCTLTATLRQDNGNKMIFSYTCTANASGVWAATALPSTTVGMYLLHMETLAGTTGPSAWSATMPNTLLVDQLGGAGSTLSTSGTVGQRTTPTLQTGVYGATYVSSIPTFTPTGNSTASAVGYANFIFIK